MSTEKDSMITSSQLLTLRWQFQLTWRLAAEVHLPALTDEACLWEPAPGSWTVRQSTDGKWRPDWSVPEPDPAPPTTIGWLLAAICKDTPAAHHEVAWPGSADAVLGCLDTLSTEWTEVLSGLDDGDLERPLAYPWSEPRPLRIALAWANSELMKNIAEIGCIRHIFEASREVG
jgi:hypothetical protein